MFVNRSTLAAVLPAVCALLVLAPTGADAATAATPRTFVNLQVAECANGINDYGTVLTDTRVITRWGKVTPGPRGLSSLSAINNRGEIAGSAGGYAALWDRRGVIKIGVAVAGDTQSYVGGLNNLGAVAGSSGGFDRRWHAFVYRNGVKTVLPDLGTDTFATGINDLGQVIGYTEVGGQQQALRWNADGALVKLRSLGDKGGHTLATSINNKGIVVGYSYTAVGTGVVKAVRWNADATVSNLSSASTTYAVASDINDAGQVVGSSTSTTVTQRGFFRAPGAAAALMPVKLGDTGVLQAVNSQGWAVGCEFAGEQTYAVMWKP